VVGDLKMLRRQSGVSVRIKESSGEPITDTLFIGTLGIDCCEYSKQAIDSVQSSAEKVIFRYMDNGSTKESMEIIEKWDVKNSDIDDFDVIFNGRNAGVGVGWNLLITGALNEGATKILICNNDVVFGPHTLDGLCTGYDRLRKEHEATVMVTAANKTKVPDQLPDIAQEWKYNEHPDFSCFMITPETVERVGYLSEAYVPAYFEDNDYHHRILLQGYKAWSTDWAPYCHIASRTRYAHPDIVSHELFRANRRQFYDTLKVNDPEQAVQDARYQAWLEKHPKDIHPNWRKVLEWCEQNGCM